ncbi:DUF374 domain-containing protein [Candidatus Poribacteria bacterium]|nr:DUF374 domain-containing protein [Candidatus Poribacteria bacterium]
MKPRKRRNVLRKARFWVLQHVGVPLFILPVKLLMRTWRFDFVGRENLARIGDPDHPAVLAILHGQFLPMIGLFYRTPEARRYRLVTLVSPSRDGLLGAEVLRRFGAEAVAGSSGSRGAQGLLELIRATRGGGFPCIVVDGPRGPRGVPKPGALKLAQTVAARLFTGTVRPARAIRFGSWDRALLPLPFSRITVRLTEFHDYATGPAPHEDQAAALQHFFLTELNKLGADPADIPEPPPC